MIDISNVKICVFGLQGSGKTVFVEYFLMNKYNHPVVYLMHEEDFANIGDHVQVIVPQDKDGNVDSSMRTLNEHSKQIKKGAKEGKIDAFIIDEADLFILKDFRQLQKYPFFHDLVINHRHYGLSMIFITRRPQELPTAITEQSAHYFIFHIAGKNVKDYLNKIHEGLGFICQNKLSKKKHNFVHLAFGSDKPIGIYSAIQIPTNHSLRIKNSGVSQKTPLLEKKQKLN